MILTGFTPIPMPIMIHHGGGYGGPVSWQDALIITACILYLVQITVVWTLLFIDDYESKISFLYWNIPFIPVFVLFIQKIISIGND